MIKQTPAAKPQEAAPATPKPANREKSKTIVLEFPVDFAGEHYPSLSIRRLKAKDFRMMDDIEGGGNATAIAMAALLCGVDEAIIDELDSVDYVRVQEAIADFFPQAMVGKLQGKASE